MNDPTERILGDLVFEVQTRAVRFINVARGPRYNLPVIVTSGLRSTAEQARLVRSGRSQTMRSKHLRGLAFDVDMLGWPRDAVPAWVWRQLGPLGESMGLTWGGSWVTFKDVGHFEL